MRKRFDCISTNHQLKLVDLRGKRIEIPVHYDMWMRGARFGVVTGFVAGKLGSSDYVTVKMDDPGVKKRLKLWRSDWPYAKVL